MGSASDVRFSILTIILLALLRASCRTRTRILTYPFSDWFPDHLLDIEAALEFQAADFASSYAALLVVLLFQLVH